MARPWTVSVEPGANNFYAQLEAWVQRHFGAGFRPMPEWSKGWAYTAAGGPWTNQPYIQNVRQAFTTGRGANDNWAYEVATLAKYDAGNLFFNPFLTQLFTP